jgi:hypothetical protein
VNLWLLVVVIGMLADVPRAVPGNEPVIAGDDWDQVPPVARSRGPPPRRRPGRRTTRLARTGTCPIRSRPVPSTYAPG